MSHKQIAIVQKTIHQRVEGKSIQFLKVMSVLSKKVKMETIGILSKILASPSGKICRDGVIFT